MVYYHITLLPARSVFMCACRLAILLVILNARDVCLMSLQDESKSIDLQPYEDISNSTVIPVTLALY